MPREAQHSIQRPRPSAGAPLLCAPRRPPHAAPPLPHLFMTHFLRIRSLPMLLSLFVAVFNGMAQGRLAQRACPHLDLA